MATQLVLPPPPQMEMLVFFRASLPLVPPGVNQCYKIIEVTSKASRRKIKTLGATEELTQFKEDAAMLLAAKQTISLEATPTIKLLQAQRRKPKKTALGISIMFCLPTLWLNDVDGKVKATIDAIFAYLGINDNQIVDQHAYKRVDAKNPRLEVEVYLIPFVS